jgi:hypothetical protein
MSDTELKLTYLIQYQDCLGALKLFDMEHPDEIAGHNALVKYSRKIRTRAIVAGVSEFHLDPLPKEK